MQVLRVAGPSWLPMASAVSLGGVFISLTFHWWLITIAFGAAFLVPLLTWLWTGTAEIPEKPTKDVGRGLTLPLYVSGPGRRRLVGDVHHHDRRRDRIRQPGLRLLLLLDDPSGPRRRP